MKKIILLLLLTLVGCASLETLPKKVATNPDKWYYIDGIKFDAIDSTYDYATKQMCIFGLSGNDTIWNTSTSAFTEYEVVRRNDSVILMYTQRGKETQF